MPRDRGAPRDGNAPEAAARPTHKQINHAARAVIARRAPAPGDRMSSISPRSFSMVSAATGRTAPLPWGPRSIASSSRMTVSRSATSFSTSPCVQSPQRLRRIATSSRSASSSARSRCRWLHAVVVPQRVREDVRGLDAAQLAPVLAGAAAHIA